MANAIASQVQALYVGYLGRAADQAGLNFWTNAIANGTSTIESVALGFTLSQEYTSKYEGLSNEELAAAIYENVLGRAADADGLAFWVGELEKGVQTPETLLAAMINSLGAVDQQTIDNKVIVANAYTAIRGDAYNEADQAASADIITGVTSDLESVAAALDNIATNVEGPGASNDSLAAALASLEAANEALEAYADAVVEASGSDDSMVDNVTEAGGVISTAVSDAFADVNTAIGALNVSAAQLAASDTPEVVQVKLSQATTAAASAVTQAQSAVSAVTGLSAASKTYLSALSTYENAVASAKATEVEKNAELARFNVLNGNTALTVGSDGAVTGVIGLNSSNELVVLDTYLSATGRTQVQKDAAAALLADIKADLAADKAEASALTAVQNAATKIDNLDDTTTVNTDGYTLDAGKVAVLVEAREEQANLAEAITEFNDANAAAAEWAELGDAVQAAQDAIEDLDFDLVQVADGAATGLGDPAVDEVFVFTGTGATGSATIDDFSGNDVLFVGNGYVLGTDSDSATIGIQGGSNAALEVFFTQSGADVVVSIETSEFGSNAATPEFQTITLTGVTVDQLTFDANTGFVNVA